MNTKFNFFRSLSVILLVIVLSMGSVIFVSAHGGDGTLIHACVNNRSGAVRIVGANTACDPNREIALDWGIQGPKGDKGDTGDVGPMGPQGPEGQPVLPQAIRSVFPLSGQIEIDTTFPNFTSVGTIELPPGKWALFATINFIMSSTTVEQVIYGPSAICQISDAPNATGFASPGAVSNLGGGASVNSVNTQISIQSLVEPASTQIFTVQCSAQYAVSVVRVQGGSIMALQVAP